MGNANFKDEWFERGDVSALKDWLEKNNVNSQNEYGNTVTHWACWHRQPAMLQLCKDRGANLNIVNNGSNTPLVLAAFRNSIECVHLLVMWEADLNVTNSQGQTALDVAVLNNNSDVAEILRPLTTLKSISSPAGSEKKVQPTIPEENHGEIDDANATGAASSAAVTTESKSPKTVSPSSQAQPSAMVRSNSFANANAKKKTKPWKDRWFERGKIASVERWARKYDVNWQNEFGNSAVHWACWHHRKNIVELLSVYGADLELKNKGDNSPLHLAAYRDAKDCVQFLISRGVDVKKENNQRQTALDVAEKLGHKDIMEMLKEAVNPTPAPQDNVLDRKMNRQEIEEMVQNGEGPTLTSPGVQKIDLKQIASLYLSLDLDGRPPPDDDELSELSEASISEASEVRN